MLYPKRLRERWGEDLVELHSRLAEGDSPADRRGWGRAVLDTLRDAPAAHFEEMRRSRRNARRSPRGGRSPLGGARRDLTTALRSLRRRPGYSLLVIATFALGLGGLLAIGTVVDGVLLRPLPFPETDRLFRFSSTERGEVDEHGTVAYLDAMDWRDQSEAFLDVAAYDEWNPILTGVGDPERLFAAQVNTSFFDVLDVEPAVGRFFLPEEDVDGQDAVVVLDHAFWQSRFGGDPGVVGRSIRLNDSPHLVVGVTSASFEDPGLSGGRFFAPVLWRPLGFVGVDEERLPNRGSESYAAIGRLRPGVDPEAARAEVAAISARLEAEYPESNAERGVVLVPLADQLVGDVRSSLWLLLVAMGLLLTIAMVNVASLMLGRTVERSTESAIRSSLGAGRGALLRPALFEGVVLAAIGGCVGVGLASPMLRAILTVAAAELPRVDRIAIDGRLLAVTALVSVAVGAVCGVLSALPSTRGALRGRLRSGASAGRSALRLRAALVAVEVALALVLLTGATVLALSFRNLERVDAGIEPEGVLTFDLSPPFARYRDREALDHYYAEVLDELRAIPGMRAVGAVNIVPLSGGFDGNGLLVEGQPSQAADGYWSIQTRSVTPGYFESIGTPILRGRGIEAGDRADAQPVAVVNETTARRFWPNGGAIGSHVEIVGADVEIVGVAADAKHLALDQPVPFQAYVSREQAVAAWQVRRMSIVLRVDGDPLAPDLGLVAAARRAVWAVDDQIPLAGLRSLQQVVDRTVTRDLLRTSITAAFAGVALLLSLIGVYGVTAYAVVLRRRELAIRMALGARRRRVVRQVARQAVRPALWGLVVGAAGSLGAVRLLESFLFGVESGALVGLALAPLLLAVAFVASWLPARHATRIEPVAALRDE